MTGGINVVVAEDAVLTREGVVGILRRHGLHVVGQAEDLDGLLRTVDRTRPHVVVTDIRMPPTGTDEGLQAARTIRERHPQTGVLVLSSHLEPRYAEQLVSDTPGGVGYLLKERVADGATLTDAVERIAEGSCVIDPSIVARLLGRRRAEDPLGALSSREREVLALMAEGRSNKAIAETLVVTERTVEAHTTSIFTKLGLTVEPGTHRRVLAVLALLRGA